MLMIRTIDWVQVISNNITNIMFMVRTIGSVQVISNNITNIMFMVRTIGWMQVISNNITNIICSWLEQLVGCNQYETNYHIDD